MKNKIYTVLYVIEFVCLIFLLYLLFYPHSNLVDTQVRLFLNNYIDSEYKPMYNLYIKDELSRLDELISIEDEKLRNTHISFTDNINEYQLGLSDYLTVSGYKVNNEDRKDYKINLLYMGENKQEYDIEIISELDIDKYISDVISYYSQFNESMKSPSFEFTGSGLRALDDGKIGKELDVEKLSNNIKGVLSDYKNIDASEMITVSYNSIEVYPTVEEINSIDTKVSTYSTGYSSSSSSRKTNIAVATRNTNGVLLSPGEVLSVDKQFRSRNASNGYAKAGSYLNGKTVQTYGGGICQVSTTLYNAILRAGIIPIERNAHSMSVGYVPLGLDAAVSEGYKDLKIKNTYDSPIYIQGIANGSTVTFNIYGKSDLLNGYTYKPGSSSSNNGLRATSWLNKYKDGEVVEKITLFNSSYRPHS